METLALPRGQALPPAGWLLGAYVFSAAGMVPPMVYTADLAVRGHGAGRRWPGCSGCSSASAAWRAR
ncbi:hypothetical protein ACFQU7_01140 [Pseudoroseomonas wenyumeiae]